MRCRAQLDYFLRKKMGRAAQRQFLAEVEQGAYDLQAFNGRDVAEAHAVIKAHDGLKISLADASIVVLARRSAIDRVLTFDGHFRTLRPGGAGSHFTVLPADA
jgi:predicted nucleic acid-binding protein